MVGTTRIELVTPAMSTQCSTTELRAHAGQAVSVREALWQVPKHTEVVEGLARRGRHPIVAVWTIPCFPGSA